MTISLINNTKSPKVVVKTKINVIILCVEFSVLGKLFLDGAIGSAGGC